MDLASYNPVIKAGFLIFECPGCFADDNKAHRIRVPLSPTRDHNARSWDHTGDLANLSLQPSVNVGCWHGVINDGKVINCQ